MNEAYVATTPKRERVRMKMCYILKTCVTDLIPFAPAQCFMFPMETLTPSSYVGMTENRLFRHFGHRKVVEIRQDYNGETEIVKKMIDDFLIYDAVARPKKIQTSTGFDIREWSQEELDYFERVNDHIIENGLIFNGRKYRPVLQSASQARQGKFYFTCLDRDEVRSWASFGYRFSDTVNISKMESRLSLVTSSGISLTDDSELDTEVYSKIKPGEFNIGTISNKEVDLTIPVTVYDDLSVLKTEVRTIKLTAHDGMGVATPLTMAKISQRLGQISKRELKIFTDEYKGINLVTGNERLNEIFVKIINCVQIRHLVDKGLLVMFPFDEHYPEYKGYDIIMTESMRKILIEDNEEVANADFDVCGYNKPKNSYVTMCYQFIQSLNISGQELVTLAHRTLERIKTTVLTNADEAMAYLGLFYNTHSLEEAGETDTKLVSKLTQILAADSRMISDRKVQHELKRLVRKSIEQMSIGKLPIRGAYYYGIMDPHFMFGAPRLGAGQFYLNNEEGLLAAFRSPEIHWSEILQLETIRVDEFWYLKDLLIFNAFDDALPRAGGADVDGDQWECTREQIVLKSLPPWVPMIYDPGKEGRLLPNNWDEITKHYKMTSKPNRVGQITNLASAFRDADLNLYNGQKVCDYSQLPYDNYIKIFRFMQGWEIDKAKTGYCFDIPKEYTDKPYTPAWLRAASIMKSKSEDQTLTKIVASLQEAQRKGGGKANIYFSNSPMSALFMYTYDFLEQFNLTEQVSDHFIRFSSYVDQAELSRLLNEGIVKNYERDYNRDIQSAMLSDADGFNRSQMIQDIHQKYTALVNALSDNKTTLAYACYAVSYDKPKNSGKGISFVWNCCFENMIELLKLDQDSMMLVKIAGVLGPVPEFAVVRDKMLFTGRSSTPIELDDGEYPVIYFEDKGWFIRAKRTIPIDPQYLNRFQKDNPYVEDELIQFGINGFRYNNTNSVLVIDAIHRNNDEFEIICSDNGYVCLAINGAILATVNKQDGVGIYNKILGKRFRLKTHGPLTYMPTRITPKTQMFNDIEAYSGNISITCFPVAYAQDYNEYENSEQVPEYVTVPSSYDGEDLFSVDEYEEFLRTNA